MLWTGVGRLHLTCTRPGQLKISVQQWAYLLTELNKHETLTQRCDAYILVVARHARTTLSEGFLGYRWLEELTSFMESAPMMTTNGWNHSRPLKVCLISP